MSRSIEDNQDISRNLQYIKFNDDIIGKGGQKKVYKAYDTVKGVEVAWNEIDISTIDPKTVNKIYQEIEILNKCGNQCIYIMKLYDSWIDKSLKKIVFITEIATSGSLRDFINKVKKVKLRIIKKWIKQLLYGIKFLHNNDIIHRDIKCDNIFINGTTGNILIGDFGLAKKMEDNITTTILGTPQFMAPEIYKEKYDERIDIYSFGMTLIEIVTQSTPYAECETIPEIWQKVLKGKKPNILKKIKHKKLRYIIEKCISKSSTRITIDELINNQFLNNDEDNDIDEFLYPFNNKEPENEKVFQTKAKILLNAEKEAKKIIKKAKQKANKIIKQAKEKTSIPSTNIKTQTSSDEEKQKNIEQLIQQSLQEIIPHDKPVII
jgi:WNK lysine deficient protein kinase